MYNGTSEQMTIKYNVLIAMGGFYYRFHTVDW